MTESMLIIIDPQNDFTHSKGYYAKKHKGISHITLAKEKIKTLFQSWDRNNVIIVYSNYHKGQFKEGVGFAIPGTFGHKVDEVFGFDHMLTYIFKTQHSAFTSTNFTDHLKETNTTTLAICGFLAEYCVKQTALDALFNQYNVILIEDCIATGDDVLERKQQMIRELKEKGAVIVDSNRYIATS
ncbi:MAG TPA: isochorismatase family cysteine hydrolase [Chitinophagaceae bacterium]|jgi:nicotinamidase-related amidase|nr:isochorismatase family cysteine hydrolase [Chitinophagaceae bacterium]